MSVNKAIIVGNLGADPEVRYTQSGTAVCNMRIATNDRYKDKSGEWQERAEWHTVVAFGNTAENCGKYLAKGRQVYVEGRIQTNEWTDNDGREREDKEIIARDVTFLSGSDGVQSNNGQRRHEPSAGNPAAGGGGDVDDSVPF